MRGAGRDARRSGTGPINRKTHNSDPEAGSDRWSHGARVSSVTGLHLHTARHSDSLIISL